MSVPAWRPMPKTEEDDSLPEYRQGALMRARHRVLMAIRWRSKEARDEDKRLRRLPEDWHEWMGCPGVDQGYGSPPCTCDQKVSSHPSAVMQRERQLRKRLSGELKFSFKERNQAALEGRTIVTEEARPLVKVVWVKTIDTAGCAPTIAPRGRPNYGVVKNQKGGEIRPGPIAGYRTAPSSGESGSASVSTRCPARLRRGARLRLPAWLTAGGRALSYLLGNCRTAR